MSSAYVRRKSWAKRNEKVLTTCPECGHKFEHDPLKFDPEDPIVKRVEKHMDDCAKKFREENPCPKCGSQ
jgi:hypothetical protein